MASDDTYQCLYHFELDRAKQSPRNCLDAAFSMMVVLFLQLGCADGMTCTKPRFALRIRLQI